ncbi:MAG: amidohydrolase [Promethearchaeota archaeon]
MIRDFSIRKFALVHGNVITMDETNPRAQAVLVIDDKIFKVGSDAEIERLIDEDTEELDLEGQTLIPGFVDCHAHPINFGLALMAVDCKTPPVNSIKEIVEKIQVAAEEKPEGEWIIGRGYDDFKLSEKRHPNRWDLDAAALNNPVIITRFCEHISVVNSLALELAGISQGTEDPDGGQIDRDPKTSEPTGVLRWNAKELVLRVIPPPRVEQLRNAIILASEQFLARGVTSVSEAGEINASVMKAYQTAIWEYGVPFRVNLMMPVSTLGFLSKLGFSTGFGDDKLRIGPIKIISDGSTSGRTAALSEPYLDAPENTGMMYISQEELNERIFAAHRADFQVGVHAIGDRAISAVLDAIEIALEKSPRADHRHRIEHCGINNPTIVSRIKKLGVIPVPQPIFLYGEGESYRAGLGEDRVKWAYPLKSYLEHGITTPMSSDCPCTSGDELISPFLGMYVAITRKTDIGREIGPEQKIDIKDALRAYTLTGAYATFEEKVKGSIEPGKLADFVILSDDPLNVRDNEIKDIRVKMTFIGGEVVYKKP